MKRYNGNTALILAIQEDQTEIDINSCLRTATFVGRANMVQYFLERGANPFAKSPEQEQTALHIAAYRGHRDIITLFKAHLKTPTHTVASRYAETLSNNGMFGGDNIANEMQNENHNTDIKQNNSASRIPSPNSL